METSPKDVTGHMQSQPLATALVIGSQHSLFQRRLTMNKVRLLWTQWKLGWAHLCGKKQKHFFTSIKGEEEQFVEDYLFCRWSYWFLKLVVVAFAKHFVVVRRLVLVIKIVLHHDFSRDRFAQVTILLFKQNKHHSPYLKKQNLKTHRYQTTIISAQPSTQWTMDLHILVVYFLWKVGCVPKGEVL